MQWGQLDRLPPPFQLEAQHTTPWIQITPASLVLSLELWDVTVCPRQEDKFSRMTPCSSGKSKLLNTSYFLTSLKHFHHQANRKLHSSWQSFIQAYSGKSCKQNHKVFRTPTKAFSHHSCNKIWNILNVQMAALLSDFLCYAYTTVWRLLFLFPILLNSHKNIEWI